MPGQFTRHYRFIWITENDVQKYTPEPGPTLHRAGNYSCCFRVRGGIEWVDLYEWGGRNKSGAWKFDKMRLGWEEPVHQLMVENNVTAVFQGHDHLYVKQEKDGIIYQEVPQPSVAVGMSVAVNEGSYRSGVIYSSPGHLKINVSSGGVTVDYVHSALPADISDKYQNGEVVYSYSIQ